PCGRAGSVRNCGDTVAAAESPSAVAVLPPAGSAPSVRLSLLTAPDELDENRTSGPLRLPAPFGSMVAAARRLRAGSEWDAGRRSHMPLGPSVAGTFVSNGRSATELAGAALVRSVFHSRRSPGA